MAPSILDEMAHLSDSQKIARLVNEVDKLNREIVSINQRMDTEVSKFNRTLDNIDHLFTLILRTWENAFREAARGRTL